MNFDDYQAQARTTRLPGAQHSDYALFGLAGEAGEVAGVKAKAIRDGWDTQTYIEKLEKELGDVLWMVSAVADDHGLDLSDIAQMNLDKLAGRKERGTLQGSGDER